MTFSNQERQSIPTATRYVCNHLACGRLCVWELSSKIIREPQIPLLIQGPQIAFDRVENDFASIFLPTSGDVQGQAFATDW